MPTLIAPPSIVPLLPSFIIAGKRRCPLRNLPPSNRQTLTPAATTRGYAMPPTIVVPQSPCPRTRTTSFRDNVTRPPWSSVVIAPHLRHHQPLLITPVFFAARQKTCSGPTHPNSHKLRPILISRPLHRASSSEASRLDGLSSPKAQASGDAERAWWRRRWRLRRW